jgi:flavin reductase (DIM6/NTAB) family NADH-FMN oxidoreductase RutF
MSPTKTGQRPGEAQSTEKVAVPPNAFYVPSPVVLVSTIDAKGTPDVSTMSAVGAACLDPALVAIGIKTSRRTYRNIRETRQFVINLPLDDLLWASDVVGTRKMRSVPNKVELAKLTLRSMPRVAAPYVHECPIAMACELATILDHAALNTSRVSHHCVIGRIVQCLVDPRWIRDNEVRLEEMPLLVYLNRYYARTGAVLETQRFTDDERTRVEKMRQYRDLRPGRVAVEP